MNVMNSICNPVFSGCRQPFIPSGDYVKDTLNGKTISTTGYTAYIFKSGSNNTLSVGQACTLYILCVGGGGGAARNHGGGCRRVRATNNHLDRS